MGIMEKIMLIAAFLLIAPFQDIKAQNDGEDYSLYGISQTLKQFQVVSLETFHNGVAIIAIQSGEEVLCGMINKQGKVVSPCKYRVMKDPSEERVAVCKEYIWGYADYEGNLVIPFQYKEVKPFSEGLAAVQTNEDEKTNSWRFIDKQGKTVIPPIERFDGKRIEAFHNGIAVLSSYDKTNKNETIFMIDRQGNVVTSEKPYRCYGRAEDLFIVRKEKRGQDYRKYGLMDKKGNMVVPAIYESIIYASEGLVAVLDKDGKVGYLDLKGAVKIPFQFDNAGLFENGIAIVKKDGILMAINKVGKTLFACPYNEVYSFSEGLALVSNNNKDGYINVKGELVIPCQFDNAHNFSEGLAVVRLNGKYGYVDKNGKNTFAIVKMHEYNY